MVKGESRQLLGNALRSILAATLLGVAIAWIARATFGLDQSYLFRTAALLCGGGLLLMWRLPAHHPFDRLGAANQVTLARGVLVALLAGVIGMSTTPRLQIAVLCTATLAAVLDAVDGWLARRTRMSSSYGARFDMETDALLILVLSLLAWQFGKAGVWVLGSGLLRYVFVAASLLFPWMQHPLPPSGRRKVLAVLQTVSLLVAIAVFVPRGVSGLVCASALAALAWSFLLDIAWLRRHASDSLVVS